MHVIAGKAQCFAEALTPEFAMYQTSVVKNAKALAKTLEAGGLRLVSGGTDNHLVLVDLTNINVTGKEAELLLDEVGITCNKNAIPYDPLKPMVTSGIRLGTAAMTTRGFSEKEFIKVGELILLTLKNKDNADIKAEVRNEVLKLTAKYPYNPY
jgi:glycine hydroxymethyltransferase